MDFKKSSGSNRGRLVVAFFLAIMTVLFALTALTFEPSAAQYTIWGVSGAMLVSSIWAFTRAFKRR